MSLPRKFNSGLAAGLLVLAACSSRASVDRNVPKISQEIVGFHIASNALEIFEVTDVASPPSPLCCDRPATAVFENSLGERIRVVVDDAGGAAANEKFGILTVQDETLSSARGVIFIDADIEVDLVFDFADRPAVQLAAFAKSIDWLEVGIVSLESGLREIPGYRMIAHADRGAGYVQRSEGKAIEYVNDGETSVTLTSARITPVALVELVEAGSTSFLERHGETVYLVTPNYSYGRASIAWVTAGHVVALSAEMDTESLMHLARNVSTVDQVAWDALAATAG